MSRVEWRMSERMCEQTSEDAIGIVSHQLGYPLPWVDVLYGPVRSAARGCDIMFLSAPIYEHDCRKESSRESMQG